MKLAPNFSLSEFEVTSTGIPNSTPADLLPNVQRLAACLQKIRDAVGASISISSGYRSPAVNAAVGGSSTSAHSFALAADINAKGLDALTLAKLIAPLVGRLDIDQLIFEKNQRGSTWVHVGLSRENTKPRGQIMTAGYNSRLKRMVYSAGLLG